MHPPKSIFRKGNRLAGLPAAALLALAALALIATTLHAQATDSPPPSPTPSCASRAAHCVFLPLFYVLRQPADLYRGFLVQNVNMRSLATSPQDALAGPPDYVWDGDNQYGAGAYHPNSGEPWTVNRAFLRYDLPQVDASQVISAALVLYPDVSLTEPGTATLRCGTWTGTPDANDWDAFGAPLATFRPADLGWTWPYTLPVAWEDLVACNGQLALVVDEAAAPNLPPGGKLRALFVDDVSGYPAAHPYPWPSHVLVAVRKEFQP
jgi:hypothetical protein